MLKLLTPQGQLTEWTGPDQAALPERLALLDLINPTKEEETTAEKWLGFQLPTREEMQEIEESSRLYAEQGAIYMTAWLPVGLETPDPDLSAVSFVLSPRCLAIVRYTDPFAFRILAEISKKHCETSELSSDAIFLLLIERTVGRIADVLQNIETDLKKLSREIFSVNTQRADGGNSNCDLNEVVKRLGRTNQLVSDLRLSLVSIARILQFFLSNGATWMRGDLAAQFRSVARDVKSMDDYTNQQTQEMTFLLDSTLGLINIQQNQIIKIMTVASVVLMPPTLIAGIYGMNFKHMPELEFPEAYPLAWLAILLSGVLPIVFFKMKKML